MQTKYYLSFEQVGIIRRIPLKEQDPDMQGILDAFIKAFRIANESDVKEDIKKHLVNELWETIYDTLCSSKDSITQETIERLHSNIEAFYKQEVTREVKPFKRRNPLIRVNKPNQLKGSQSNCLFLYVEPQLY